MFSAQTPYLCEFFQVESRCYLPRSFQEGGTGWEMTGAILLVVAMIIKGETE